MDLLERSFGTLVIDKGVIITAEPLDENQTVIILAAKDVGKIVRDHETGLWYYDSELRETLGIREDPRFETDARAGDHLQRYLPDLSEINALARRIISEHPSESSDGTAW